MKRLVKLSIAQLVCRLPRGAQDVIVDEIIEGGRVRYESFSRLAETFNVTTLKVRGDYGEFQSVIHDWSILGAYARTGSWGERTNGYLRRFFAAHDGGTYIDVGANIGLTTVPIMDPGI